jgi:hypothetical protein
LVDVFRWQSWLSFCLCDNKSLVVYCDGVCFFYFHNRCVVGLAASGWCGLLVAVRKADCYNNPPEGKQKISKMLVVKDGFKHCCGGYFSPKGMSIFGLCQIAND